MCIRFIHSYPFFRLIPYQQQHSNTGFLCLVIYRRDTHVVELQIGNLTSRLEDACAPDQFDATRTPFTTLLGEFLSLFLLLLYKKTRDSRFYFCKKNCYARAE